MMMMMAVGHAAVVPLLARARGHEGRRDGREAGATLHERVEVEGDARGGRGDGDARHLVRRLHERGRLDRLELQARRPWLGLGEDRQRRRPLIVIVEAYGQGVGPIRSHAVTVVIVGVVGVVVVSADVQVIVIVLARFLTGRQLGEFLVTKLVVVVAQRSAILAGDDHGLNVRWRRGLQTAD